jgi:hypothetical protein
MLGAEFHGFHVLSDRTQRLSGGNLFLVFRCDGGFGRCPPAQAVHPASNPAFSDTIPAAA